MAPNPHDGFAVNSSTIAYLGRDLQRPECILAEKDGRVWSADERGGVVRISPDGNQEFIAQRVVSGGAIEGTVPNGMAIADNGDLLIANFGTHCMERMQRDGDTRVMFDTCVAWRSAVLIYHVSTALLEHCAPCLGHAHSLLRRFPKGAPAPGSLPQRRHDHHLLSVGPRSTGHGRRRSLSV